MEEISNFIDNVIKSDLENGLIEKVHTRFPPEPNGYLHIGHCKALCIDFGMAQKYNGICNLRMDDTNPAKEDTEYVDAIQEDIHWLGFDWDNRFFYGSDYFEKTFDFALQLIEQGKAYVCELSQEDFKKYRGDINTPAISPYRDRPIHESKDLFLKMRKGEFPEGSMTLRAKIDLTSGNFNMRDPVIYRIKYIEHHRQGTKWCVFPMYDFAHPIQDALEGITHSLCSLEYEDHRPLYNWVVDNLGFQKKPHQYEFARLNLTYTVMSKRFLRSLVEGNYVDGWDDPRMPTLCGLRRRGYTAASIKDFVGRIGVAKSNSIVDIELLEHCIREELNSSLERRIAVLDPIKVIITNYPDNKEEYFTLPNNPQNSEVSYRKVLFSKELYIDRSDFSDNPPPKFFRLKPNSEVRLMGAYIIKCNEVVYDEKGDIKEIHCSADFESGANNPIDGRKIKGTIHWVSAKDCFSTEIRLYDRLFSQPDVFDLPEGKDYFDILNKDSVKIYPNAKCESSIKDADKGERFQFVRVGYFIKDMKLPNVFNMTVNLKDSYKA